MNCSTVIASPLDRHSCLDKKICGFETSGLEEGLTCSKRDSLGGKHRETPKKKKIHHIFHRSSKLMKPFKQKNWAYTGLPRSLADI